MEERDTAYMAYYAKAWPALVTHAMEERTHLPQSSRPWTGYLWKRRPSF